MRGSRFLSPSAASVEVAPLSDGHALDLAALFGRSAPLEVDLGCGDGLFLSQLAAEHPERNFLGVERLVGRVRSACKKIARRELRNARVLRCEISSAVEELLPSASVDVFHLLFSDPWPKRRHQNRRVVTETFLRCASRALKGHGRLRIATDDAHYFTQILRVADLVSDLGAISESEAAQLPPSTFETRFRGSGREIHRLVLRKVSAGK
ncbi:MAG: tRNA (guanosine(46)-N7)-methyltransferase TrmB [Chthoniobacterales bacterium]